jgi:hypothetical protein
MLHLKPVLKDVKRRGKEIDWAVDMAISYILNNK